jgi:Tol biopolymer transport system component
LATNIVAQSTRRLSVTAANQEIPGAIWPEISADGRFVTFVAPDSNLVPGDTNGTTDVFVKDVTSGAVVRASLTALGVQPNGNCFQPKLSADGRFVAFSTWASNLAASDINGHDTDIFVKDLQTGALEHVSVGNQGIGGNGISAYHTLSADGRFVSFYSYSTNFVPNVPTGSTQVYLFDRTMHQIECLSVDLLTGIPLWGGKSSVSADGRFVAFETGPQAAGLPSSGSLAIAVRDRVTGTVTVVNVLAGVIRHAESPLISADGSTVLFSTLFAMSPLDTDNAADVYAVDRVSGAIELVSRTPPGSPSAEPSGATAISADGRFVTFGSADAFDAGDTNGVGDAFVADRATAAIERISTGQLGALGNDRSSSGGISDNGRYAVFLSLATNLVPNDTNASYDVFLRDRCPPAAAQLYGIGYAGTGGVIPSFGLLGVPAIGTAPALGFGNPSGTQSIALFVLGVQAVAVQTPVLGTLLASPDFVQPLLVPSAGLVLPVAIPDLIDLCGVQLFAQALLLDAGAAAGVAFTRGLHVTIGG